MLIPATDFRIGDAVVKGQSDTIFVVSAIDTTHEATIRTSSVDNGFSSWNHPSMLSRVTAPDWVIQWRKANMRLPVVIEPIDAREAVANALRETAQEDIELAALIDGKYFEPLETPVDTEKSDIPYEVYAAQYDTIVELRAANQRLVDRNETLTKKLAKRDKTVTALEREAGNLQRKLENRIKQSRDNCDLHENNNAQIAELTCRLNAESHEYVKVAKKYSDVSVKLDVVKTQNRTLKEDAAKLRQEARNDCDNIELLNAAITEFREEKEAHIKRFHEAERDLKSATTTRDASIQTADAQLEALSSARKELKMMTGWRDGALESSNSWCAEYQLACRELQELKEELAAEKAFTTCDDEKQELVRLRSVHANVLNKLSETRQILKGAEVSRDSWRGRAERAELSIINARIEEIGYEENQHDFEVLNNECTRWAQKYNEAEGEIETLNEMLKNSTDTRVLLENALEIEKRRLPGPPVCPACTEEMASISKQADRIVELKKLAEFWKNKASCASGAWSTREREIERLSDLLVSANNETHMSEVALTARTAERDHWKHDGGKWKEACLIARSSLAEWQQHCANSNATKRDLQQKLDAVKKAAGDKVVV